MPGSRAGSPHQGMGSAPEKTYDIPACNPPPAQPKMASGGATKLGLARVWHRKLRKSGRPDLRRGGVQVLLHVVRGEGVDRDARRPFAGRNPIAFPQNYPQGAAEP